MNGYAWYASLLKPSWAPPAWLFGPVWTGLYTVIALSFGRVFFLTWKKVLLPKTALPFALNLIFNFAFTPIQFGLKSNILAAVDIVLLLGTLIWAIIAIYPFQKWIAYAQIPYLLWVTFATILQFTITGMNW
ncbi:MAG: TspO/MBR family protein [Candidatus Peregrinibacteria bacterium]